MEKKYILEDLDCANCAMKIERQVGKLTGVKEVSVDFVQKKMFVDMEHEQIEDAIIKLIQQVEPDIHVVEYTKTKSQPKETSKDVQSIDHGECKSEKEHEHGECGDEHHHHEHEGCECGDDQSKHEERVIEGARKLYIKGLDCANCANKIESYVAKMENVKDASLNFSTGVLFTKFINNKKAEDTIEEIIKIVPTLEDGVSIEKEKSKVNIEKTSLFSIKTNWRLYTGIILFIIATVLEKESYSVWIYLAAYAFAGIRVVYIAFKNILKGEVFDENFLMSIATIGALSIRSYEEAVAVMIFYEIGEMFQSYAINRSRKSISSLMNIRADYANRVVDGKEEKVSPEDVGIDDLVIVKPGERVPLDGVVVKGTTSLDTSALTGESMPRDVTVQDEVLAGVVNLNGVITLRVTKEYGESTVSRILELVENASSKKAPMEKFITKFAKIYTPIVVFLAIVLAVLPPLIIPQEQFSVWLYRALTFLVVSCPCALVVSVPLGMFAGIGAASKRGILIKGGNYLEALRDIDTVVFDKTGTLTKGVFKVVDIYTQGIEKEELLKIAAYGENYSNHPIAMSIKAAYGNRIDAAHLSDYEEVAGNGVHVTYQGKDVLLGNYKLMDNNQIVYKEPDVMGTIIHVAIDKQYRGYLVIDDEIKETSKQAIVSLKQSGVKKCVMLSGDRKAVGFHVADILGLDEVHMQLLPADKVEKVEELLEAETQGHKLAFVGDGINDAPVLARADVGVAMGGIGSDAAIEAADVVLMKDDPSALSEAIRIARKTMVILWQNITFSLGVKVIILILTAFGIANMWMGVFADVGVTLLAVLNSMRALKVE